MIDVQVRPWREEVGLPGGKQVGGRGEGRKEGRKTRRLAVFISTRTGGGKEDEKRMRREDEEEPREGQFGGKLI